MTKFLIGLCLLVCLLPTGCKPWRSGSQGSLEYYDCLVLPNTVRWRAALPFRGTHTSMRVSQEELIEAFENGPLVLEPFLEKRKELTNFIWQDSTLGSVSNIISNTVYLAVEQESAGKCLARVFFGRENEDWNQIDAYLKLGQPRSEHVAATLDGEVFTLPFELSSGLYVFKAVYSNDFILVEGKTLQKMVEAKDSDQDEAVEQMKSKGSVDKNNK